MLYLRATAGNSPMSTSFLPSAPAGQGTPAGSGSGGDVEGGHPPVTAAGPQLLKLPGAAARAVGLPHVSGAGSQAGACHRGQLPGEHDKTNTRLMAAVSSLQSHCSPVLGSWAG